MFKLYLEKAEVPEIKLGRALKEKTLLPDDTQKLDNLLGEVRDKWDTVCGKSVER